MSRDAVRVLQRTADSSVVIEPGNTVRKTYYGQDSELLRELAIREFHRLSVFNQALVDLPYASCPRPLELVLSREPYVRMERASGFPLQDYLNFPVWNADLYAHVGRTLREALVRYVETFDEPYWDFRFGNMLYDPETRVVTFVDFGIPAYYKPRLAEFSRYGPVECSLAKLISSPIMQGGRRKKIFRRREFRQALKLVAAVLDPLVDGSEGIEVEREKVRQVAALSYYHAVRVGRLSQAWFRSYGALMTRPSGTLDALCKPPKPY